jgi:(2Fe-2S) ferredoxin
MAAGSDTALVQRTSKSASDEGLFFAGGPDSCGEGMLGKARLFPPRRMPPYLRHVFVCTNRRPADNPKGSCAMKGSEAVLERFKEELHARGLKGKMRANAAGCLDACAFGTSVVVYPEGVWYGGVQVEDVVEIIESHLLGNSPVERLRMKGTQPAAIEPG